MAASSRPKPARLCPGAAPSDVVRARGWTQKDLAAVPGRPQQAITEIVRGTKQITPDTAVGLGAAFPPHEFWSSLGPTIGRR